MSVKEVPLEKTPAQIIQMGQNAAATSSYKNAIYCFNTAIDRYGDDANIYAEAKYEIAHVYLKQKKYEQAYNILTELLEIYDYYPTVLPPAYKKLANIAMSKIPEKKLAEIQKKNQNAEEDSKTQLTIENSNNFENSSDLDNSTLSEDSESFNGIQTEDSEVIEIED